MEQQKLPNVTIALVLAILSILCCCLPYGAGSILLGGIALYLVNKDKKILESSDNPDSFTNAKQLGTARIIAIIGLIIGVILLILAVYLSVSGQDQVWVDYLEQMQRELEANQ
jgi:ABC-type Fe3+ transport system permease subunit